MNNTKSIRKNPNMVTRVIEDETILMPVYKTSKEINCIYTLNKAGSFVWERIDGKNNIAEIKKEVLDKFDTTQEEMEKEMEDLLKDLKEIKAII